VRGSRHENNSNYPVSLDYFWRYCCSFLCVVVMLKLKLSIKVFFVSLLRSVALIPDVWYSCDIELASLRAKELSDFFEGKEID